MARIKAASFDDRLTLVEHLDELRTRLIFCGVALVVAAIVCFWQNHLLLDIANGPLPDDVEPLTFSPSEPFMTTLTLVLYSAILLTLPILLYQAYAFILPALTPGERKVILPILLMVPMLFVAGVVFAYFVVVPAAIKFLLNFNDDQFNIQIRAREYYSFFSLTLISVGILFQIPIGILAVTRLGIVTPDQLAKNRRYAILIIAVLAMLLPGTDPITMLLSMLPLVLLFEFSLIFARVLGRPGKSRRNRGRAGRAPGRIDRLDGPRLPACSSSSAASESALIQVIYVCLALLMFVGLVGLGIGSSVSGGIFDALGIGGGNTSSSPQYDAQIERAEKTLQTDPKDEKALLSARPHPLPRRPGGDRDRRSGPDHLHRGDADRLPATPPPPGSATWRRSRSSPTTASRR